MTVQAGTAHGREHLGFPDGVIAPGKLLCHSAGRERIAVRVMKIRGRHDERQLDLLSVYGSVYHVKYKGQMVEALGKMIARGAVRVDICSTFTR